MNRARAGVVFAILAPFAIWGCAQGSNPETTERLNVIRHLQEEIRSLSATEEKLRKELGVAKNDISRLQAELRTTVQDRDTFKEQLTARTAERDAQLANLEQLRKGLRSLVDQAETMVPTTPQPVGTKETGPANRS